MCLSRARYSMPHAHCVRDVMYSRCHPVINYLKKYAPHAWILLQNPCLKSWKTNEMHLRWHVFAPDLRIEVRVETCHLHPSKINKYAQTDVYVSSKSELGLMVSLSPRSTACPRDHKKRKQTSTNNIMCHMLFAVLWIKFWWKRVHVGSINSNSD